MVLILCGAVFYFSNKSTKSVVLELNKNAAEKENDKVSEKQDFFISGWLPYWRKAEGAQSLDGKINLFSEINPFALSVNPNGSLRDDIQLNNFPWPELRGAAEKASVKVVPTILWGDAAAMHKIFSDDNLRAQHIDAIAELLQKNNFSGVDIDYEGKDMADREIFSGFMKELHAKLDASGKTMNCTVEARTQDVPPPGWSGTRAMAFANDFFALNRSCDSVRVMAYDQIFQTYGEKGSFVDTNSLPTAPNADNQWVEEVVRYALRSIAPEKLVLGVPTYGWEFKLTKLPDGYRYTRVKSVSFGEALAKAKTAGVEPMRSGGELSFVYQAADGRHIITFSDAEAVRQKINIAQKFQLKGVSLFKLDGLADPELYSVLKKKP